MSVANVREVLAKIGYVLLHIQATERVVKLAMQVAMPGEAELLFTSIAERVTSKDVRRPLGPFLAELRKRATLHDDVDDLLTRFLTKRNAFIHNLAEVDGWSITTEAGIATAHQHLGELLDESKQVRTHFLGLLYSWKVQTGLKPTEYEEEGFAAIAEKFEGGILSRKWGTDA